MNKHSCAARMLAMLLCVMLALGAAPFTAAAADGDDGYTESIASLTDLLAVDRYAVYKSRYTDVPRASATVEVDVLDYSAEDTTAAIGEGEGQVHVGTYANQDAWGNRVAGTEQEGLYCPDTGAVGWKVTIPESGMYAISFEYYPVGDKASAIERTLYVDGVVPFYEARFLTCSKVWADKYPDSYTGVRDGAFRKDVTGNEIRPEKAVAPEWRSYDFSESSGNYVDPFEFYFEAGEHVFQLEAQREPIVIKSITVHPYEKEPSYEEYLGKYSGAERVSAETIAQANGGEDRIMIEAELYSTCSDKSIYPLADRTSAISSPQDASRELLNAIGDDKWKNCGQWAEWKVTVPKAGFYKIGVRFRQNINDGLFSSRVLRINGEIPFDEAKYLQFDAGDVWDSCYLNNGAQAYADGFCFYLNEGENTISLEAGLGNMADIILRLNAVVNTINSAYINILMITGTTPDSNRNYNFYQLIPDSIDDLAAMSDELYDITNLLNEISGKSENTTTLENIARRLYKMGNKEDEVAKNLSGLKSDIGSLGTWLQKAMTQPLALDYITVQSADAGEKQLPRAKESFLQSLWFEVRMFGMSFVADYNTLGALEDVDEDQSVVVWTTSGRDQAKIIRNLINNDYTPSTGINVSLKLTVAGSLLPSVLAGVGPDVSLDLASSDVINWAIRDALIPLNDFEGFDEILSEFPDAATIPLTLYTDTIIDYDKQKDGPIRDDQVTAKTYGLPMTLDFAMMFYRADIFQNLGLEVPRTWNDFYTILPILQNNQMSVVFPTSSGGENLFLYQMLPEGTSVRDGLYQDNGRRIGLDSNLALQAFDELCTLFTQYKLPVAPNFENQFRTGEIPLGIVGYSVYTQLSVFAPEIKGLWEFVPLPGWEDENGKINNCAIGTVTAIVMPRGDRSQEKANNAFNFMSWYVGHKNQANYADEYSAWMGQNTKFNTANQQALTEMPWSAVETQNLMAQFNNLAAVPEYPGSYIVTRNVNFAFMNAYNNNADPVESMLDYITEINKEISRKRKEFNLDSYEISYSSNYTESIN